MSFKKTIKNIIRKSDVFGFPATFCYNEEPVYQSIAGGVMSICLIAFFVGIFASTLIKTFGKEYIDFKQSNFNEPSPSYFTTTLNRTFMFAIGLDGIDVNRGQRYFDLYMQFRHYNSTHKIRTNIPLEPCKRVDWQNLGFGDAYDRLNLTRWLCPSSTTVLQLQGKFTSDNFKFYKFAVSKCQPSLDLTRPCMNNSAIQTYLNTNQAFKFNFYFINTIINAGDQVYIKRYLEDVNYFPFSPTEGIDANLFVSSYKISTDNSLLLVQDTSDDFGGVVKNPAQALQYKVRSNQYAKFYIRKSPLSIEITRSFRRIDDTFAYIGGLFSTLLLMFRFMNLYNQLSYQMQVLKNSFYFDKNDPFDSDQFNILTYFVYLIYFVFEKFGIQLCWKKYQRFHNFVENGKKQLDMRVIMKKILYAERLGSAVLDQTKHKMLLLSQPFTLAQAEVTRRQLRFYKNFRKKYFPSNQIQYQVKKPKAEQITKKSKVMPLHQDTLQHDQQSASSQQQIKIQSKQAKVYTIKRQQQFNFLDSEMKAHLQKLSRQVQRNDPVSRRIFDKIDDRIKKKYLSQQVKIPAKIKLPPAKPKTQTK